MPSFEEDFLLTQKINNKQGGGGGGSQGQECVHSHTTKQHWSHYGHGEKLNPTKFAY